jgi:CheY-like chemotaxis protein
VPVADDIQGEDRRCVLLVDDDETSRVVTREMLRRLGFAVVVAEDGFEGLGVYAAERERLALVVSDLLMPRMSGKELLLELRSREPDLPVLIASGYWDEHTFDELAEAGATGFLRKPYGLEELANAVGEVLCEAPRVAAAETRGDGS